MAGIKISILHGDAFLIPADTLVLKYAQAAYGLDSNVIRGFEAHGLQIENSLPKVWEFFFTDSNQITNTKNIIFIGVPPLRQFGYKEIREFGKKALSALASSDPKAVSIILTIHGPGYGLDETEAFESQIAGIIDGIASGDYPQSLKEITFVERSERRASRLQEVLLKLFPGGDISTSQSGELNQVGLESAETLRNVGYISESKKRVFVAMPFASEFDDHFHYGIQGAINACGYLCERADLESFTGDVMDWVKNRIASAHFIIADLTTANPNVYLEVGFAWGLNKPTVLLIKDTNELKFDTRGQRCLTYTSIKDLEAKLKIELTNLKI